jgi:hypothetical protein
MTRRIAGMTQSEKIAEITVCQHQKSKASSLSLEQVMNYVVVWSKQTHKQDIEDLGQVSTVVSHLRHINCWLLIPTVPFWVVAMPGTVSKNCVLAHYWCKRAWGRCEPNHRQNIHIDRLIHKRNALGTMRNDSSLIFRSFMITKSNPVTASGSNDPNGDYLVVWVPATKYSLAHVHFQNSGFMVRSGASGTW